MVPRNERQCADDGGAAEANLIARREETAAMRSQANAAKLFAGNPTLMRLRELEILEKVAAGYPVNDISGIQPILESRLG